jgi:hypothetical protein
MIMGILLLLSLIATGFAVVQENVVLKVLVGSSLLISGLSIIVTVVIKVPYHPR